MGMFFLLSHDASGCEGAENIRTLKLCLDTQTSVQRKKTSISNMNNQRVKILKPAHSLKVVHFDYLQD